MQPVDILAVNEELIDVRTKKPYFFRNPANR